MRCLSCQYDLKNLAENRCPECGRAFDPDDSRTFAVPLVMEPMRANELPGALVATFMSVLIGIFMLALVWAVTMILR